MTVTRAEIKDGLGLCCKPMHDPLTQICSFPSYDARRWMEKRRWIPNWLAHLTLFTLWHRDPERRGSDDSCGWFKRAQHGDQKVLAKIAKRFEEDWDRTWTYDPNEDGFGSDDKTKRTYCRGLLNPAGMPRFSTIGIVLNLFFLAANEYFSSDGRSNWKRANTFMGRHLFEIMLFAENPTDSLFDSLNCTFGQDSSREDRIRGMAATIYGWILRADQPWYRHARWHLHHWRFQIHPWQSFRRWAFDRCCRCGKGFKWGECVIGSWSGKQIWHDVCSTAGGTPAGTVADGTSAPLPATPK